MAKKKRSRRSASHSALGCLFWVSLIAAVVIAAIAAREPLREALEKLFKKDPGAGPTVVVKPLSNTESGEAAKPDVPQKTVEPDAKKPADPGAESGEERPPVAALQVQEQKPETASVRKAHLFFTTVDADGSIALKGVIRSIPSSDAPLKDTIQTLLKGPTSQEVNLGMLTMIPAESRLLGVTLRGDTAFMDFNESFRFNTLGTEGLNAQLRQVVYAATEFPTVKNVQILIEGKKVQYLGSEGIRIDSPLGRQSFKD